MKKNGLTKVDIYLLWQVDVEDRSYSSLAKELALTPAGLREKYIKAKYKFLFLGQRLPVPHKSNYSLTHTQIYILYQREIELVPTYLLAKRMEITPQALTGLYSGAQLVRKYYGNNLSKEIGSYASEKNRL